MTATFGKTNQANTQNTNTKNSNTKNSRRTQTQKISNNDGDPSTLKLTGTIIAAILSIIVVVGGLYLLMTDKASLLVVMMGVFLYSMSLMLIGKLIR